MHEESQQSPPTAVECPPMEELACLVDGVLSPEDSEVTLGHILVCPKCYEIYIGLLRFQLAHPSEGLERTKGKVPAFPPLRPPMSSTSDTNRHWGRFRQADMPMSLNPVALLLERLVYREGLTFDEACEALRTRHGVESSREQLESLSRALPPRVPRRRVDVVYLEDAPSREPSPEEAAMAREGDPRRAEFFSFLQEAVASLPADEQLLFRLLFREGLSIAEIARLEKLDQKSLYRRRDKILRSLREHLRDRGVKKDEFDSLFLVSDARGGEDSGGD